jgi:hypothetical protein
MSTRYCCYLSCLVLSSSPMRFPSSYSLSLRVAVLLIWMYFACSRLLVYWFTVASKPLCFFSNCLISSVNLVSCVEYSSHLPSSWVLSYLSFLNLTIDISILSLEELLDEVKSVVCIESKPSSRSRSLPLPNKSYFSLVRYSI